MGPLRDLRTGILVIFLFVYGPWYRALRALGPSLQGLVLGLAGPRVRGHRP